MVWLVYNYGSRSRRVLDGRTYKGGGGGGGGGGGEEGGGGGGGGGGGMTPVTASSHCIHGE